MVLGIRSPTIKGLTVSNVVKFEPFDRSIDQTIQI